MSATTPIPTAEQEARAKWDLLLLDIEHRSEQLRHIKGANPLEMEQRIEQLRQLKTYEPKRLIIQGLTMMGVLLAAGAALGAFMLRLAQGVS